MTQLSLENKLFPLLQKILRIELVTDELDMDNTATWTSLRHVQLLAEIERTFSLQISDIDAFQLISVKRLIEYLSARTTT